MLVEYPLFFGFALLMLIGVDARSITLLDNADAELFGEDSKVPRKIIAPLLTEEELSGAERHPTIRINIRPHNSDASQVDFDTDKTQVDEYSEDPFESK